MAASHLVNMARMTTATSGTGTITLGSAVASFLSFAAAGIADGETVTYIIEDANGTGRETGTGVYTASGTTLTRNVINSTNGNAAISLSGSAQVALGVLAQDVTNKRGDTMGGALNWATAVTITAAATTNIGNNGGAGAATSNYVIVSGNTTITAFDTIAQGAFRWLRFTGTPQLTHNATTLVLNNNGNNITVAAGDIGLAISEGSGNWRYYHFPAGGLFLINANNLSDVSTALTAFNNISPLTSRGDLLTRDATNNKRLAIGATDTIVRSSAGTDPSWSTASSWFDAVFGSTTGLVPQRGASLWSGAAVGGAITPTVDVRTASATITIPTGATKCLVTLLGSGGGGGGCTQGAPSPGCCQPAVDEVGGNGGFAGALIKYLSGLTPGNTLALTIGAAGSGGAAGNHDGTDGGDTTLASGSQSITTLTASKGGKGLAGSAGVAGANGTSGSGTNGDLNFTAKLGQTGMAFGFAAVQTGNSFNGSAGLNYGAGGNGGFDRSPGTAARAGGNGTAGFAIFEWAT